MSRQKIDPRERAVAEFERKVQQHQTAIQFIKDIPLNEIIHITQLTFVELDDKTHTFEDRGWLVVPFKINLGSFRSRVVGLEESHGWRSKQIIEADNRGEPYCSAIGFLNIKSWRRFEPFNRTNAGLYVNWTLVTETKTLIFGA